MIRALTGEELEEDAASDVGFGAIDTERGCLPLRALAVDVRIDGLMATTTVRQQFANVFDEPLEATYIFPLPPRAAVIGFRMTVAGATVSGRIDERRKARKAYEKAVAEGRRGAIAEEERPDVFTLRVGNIPPRSAARIEFTLVAPPAVDAAEATYRFPLVVAPRYCPGVPLDGEAVGDGTADDTDLVPDASRISPPVLLPGMMSPVRLDITARIAGSAIAPRAAADAVGCSLAVDAEASADGGMTATVVPGQRLDRDFVLRWPVGTEAAEVAAAAVEPDAGRPAGLGTGGTAAEAPGDGTFAVTIVPPPAAGGGHRPRDVVFVIDRSGSMAGWKIAAARRAAARMIDSLTTADRVAVLAFDGTLEYGGGAPALAEATDRHRWRLLEWLGRLDARGGTDLSSALSSGLDICGAARSSAAGTAARDRFLVLVTDGQVGGEDSSVRSISRRLGDTRLFIVGIDSAVNDGLLGRLADASGGLVELVESENRLDDVMDRIRSRITPPLVTAVRLEGEGLELIEDSFVPARIPDLVPGVPLVVRGRYRHAAAVARIHVTGRHATEGTWAVVADVAPATAAGLGSLWARGRLRSLEDRLVTGSQEARGTGERGMVELSASFGVLCRFTAVVAIAERDPGHRGRMRPRRIVQPVEAPAHPEWDAGAVAFRSAGGTLGVLSMAHPHTMPGVIQGGLHAQFECDCLGEADPAATTASGRPSRPRRPAVAAARLLADVRPASGDVGDVTIAAVRRFVTRLRRLVGRVAASSPLGEFRAGVAISLGTLSTNPADRQALVEVLDWVATFAETGGGHVDRWWLAPSARQMPETDHA